MLVRSKKTVFIYFLEKNRISYCFIFKPTSDMDRQTLKMEGHCVCCLGRESERNVVKRSCSITDTLKQTNHCDLSVQCAALILTVWCGLVGNV